MCPHAHRPSPPLEFNVADAAKRGENAANMDRSVWVDTILFKFQKREGGLLGSPVRAPLYCEVLPGRETVEGAWVCFDHVGQVLRQAVSSASSWAGFLPSNVGRALDRQEFVDKRMALSS